MDKALKLWIKTMVLHRELLNYGFTKEQNMVLYQKLRKFDL